MSTYSLSGSGTHALTAGTTGLQVTITTPSVIQGVGRSNPVAHYDVGLLRFSDGTSYWSPVSILGGPQFIPVPANATSMGYALLGGAAISVVEVIGGTVFFSGGASSLASLSDVLLASVADTEVLTWNAAAGKWENAAALAGPAGPTGPTGPAGAPGGSSVISDQALTGTAAAITAASLPGTSTTLRIVFLLRTDAGSQTIVDLFANGDTTTGDYRGNGGSGRITVCFAADATSDLFSPGEIILPDYANSISVTKGAQCVITRPDGAIEYNSWYWKPGSPAAITQVQLKPRSGSFVAGSRMIVLGM